MSKRCPRTFSERVAGVGNQIAASTGTALAVQQITAAVAGKWTSMGHVEVAEAPWSGAEWAVALRFDNLRGTALVLLLG